MAFAFSGDPLGVEVFEGGPFAGAVFAAALVVALDAACAFRAERVGILGVLTSAAMFDSANSFFGRSGDSEPLLLPAFFTAPSLAADWPRVAALVFF